MVSSRSIRGAALCPCMLLKPRCAPACSRQDLPFQCGLGFASFQQQELSLDERLSRSDGEWQVQAEGLPVVGVWLSGVRSVRDPHVWAACIRFLLSAHLLDKAIQPDLAFLVLVYAFGVHPSSFPWVQCDDCRPTCDVKILTFCVEHAMWRF